jgi:hypothetical protein
MGTVPQSVLHPALMPQSRALGDDLAPPRQLYFMFIPATLALTGILSWMIGNEPGMVLASVVASAVAVFTLWEWLFLHAPTRFSTLLGMTLLLGYGLGTLNTWATLPRAGLTLAEVAGLSEGILARGIAVVLISSATLYFLGEIFEKPVFGRDFQFRITPRTRMLIYIGTLAILAGYPTHSLSFQGVTSGGGHESIPGAFLAWLYTPLTAVAVIAFLTAARRLDKVLTGFSALILLAMFSVTGRRITIYTSMEVLLVMGLVGFRWREKIVRNVLVILTLAAIMVSTSLTFMLLRISGSMAKTRKQITIGRQFQIAGKLVQKGGAYTLAAKNTQANFQSRTFVLAFLANILDASTRMTPALGSDAVGYIQLAIPSILYPEKHLFFAEENLVDQQFGFSYGDQANSVLTTGATDFGLIGMLLYPLLVVVIFRIIFDFIAKRLATAPVMFVALVFIYTMLQTEISLTGYCDTLRDTILFSIALVIFMAFPTVRLHAS